MDEDIDIRRFRSRGPLYAACAALAALACAIAFVVYGVIADDPPAPPPAAGAPSAPPVVTFEPVVIETFRVIDDVPESAVGAARLVVAQTVVVRGAPLGTPSSYGSGFVFRDGVVVTAAHVVPEDVDAASVYCGGAERAAAVAHRDDLNDIVVLHAPGCGGAALRFDTGTHKRPLAVHVAGYNFNDGSTVATRYHRTASSVPDARVEPVGMIESDTRERLARMEEEGAPPLAAIDVVCIPGNSGSPVYRGDAIVGMLVIRDPAHGRSYMVPAVSLALAVETAGLP
jgi:S1-C subfamily serine protease